MDEERDALRESLISIASETFRFQNVFIKAISKLDVLEQNKYLGQYGWFSKKVYKALDRVGLRLVSVAGEFYDPGMAVTPLNLEDFGEDDRLYVEQMMEPIIMSGTDIVRTGTVILGRIEE